MVVRSSPNSFRLTFLLPDRARPARSGAFRGWVADCELSVQGGFIAISGPSRERVMEQAARLIRVACQDLREISIAATLESPPPVSGRDGWTIIVNADIAFAPTALGATFPGEQQHAAAQVLVG
jgi:hypothetical protein